MQVAEILLSRYDIFIIKNINAHYHKLCQPQESKNTYATACVPRLRNMLNLIAFDSKTQKTNDNKMHPTKR
jgi:hypothetical protein